MQRSEIITHLEKYLEERLSGTFGSAFVSDILSKQVTLNLAEYKKEAMSKLTLDLRNVAHFILQDLKKASEIATQASRLLSEYVYDTFLLYNLDINKEAQLIQNLQSLETWAGLTIARLDDFEQVSLRELMRSKINFSSEYLLVFLKNKDSYFNKKQIDMLKEFKGLTLTTLEIDRLKALINRSIADNLSCKITHQNISYFLYQRLTGQELNIHSTGNLKSFMTVHNLSLFP